MNKLVRAAPSQRRLHWNVMHWKDPAMCASFCGMNMMCESVMCIRAICRRESTEDQNIEYAGTCVGV